MNINIDQIEDNSIPEARPGRVYARFNQDHDICDYYLCVALGGKSKLVLVGLEDGVIWSERDTFLLGPLPGYFKDITNQVSLQSDDTL